MGVAVLVAGAAGHRRRNRRRLRRRRAPGGGARWADRGRPRARRGRGARARRAGRGRGRWTSRTRGEARARGRARRALDVVVVDAGANQPEPFLDVARGDLRPPVRAQRPRRLLPRAGRRAGCCRRGGASSSSPRRWATSAPPDRSVYCATKHALEGLVKALALELAPRGVRVVSVAPTFVRTEMTAAQLDDPRSGRGCAPRSRSVAWRRPRRSADAVAWLASPRRGDVNGHQPAASTAAGPRADRSVSLASHGETSRA